MKAILVFIIGIGVGIAVVWYWTRKRKCEVSEQERVKQERKEKILLALRNSKENKLANNDVEKLVGVSDATAERYLDELPARNA